MGFFIFLCLRDKGYLFISLKHGEYMRKLVVFVMLMTCVISAQAQWKVTPEAGMNVTKYKGDAAKVGFKAGAAVSYTFGSGWFSLQSGLYYVRRGRGCLLIVRFMELVRVHMGTGRYEYISLSRFQ